MLIRLGEIMKDAREYKEITRAELAKYAGVSEEQITFILYSIWSLPLNHCHYLDFWRGSLSMIPNVHVFGGLFLRFFLIPLLIPSVVFSSVG